MITSARVDLARSEALLADGMVDWFRGEQSPNAIAAGRIAAETVIMWRRIMQSKFEK